MKSLLIAVSIAMLFYSTNLFAQISFDDSDNTLMTVDNGIYYSVGFNKQTGGLEYIIDKTSNQQLCYGSKDKLLWQTAFEYRRHDEFPINDHLSSLNFSYAWSSDSNTLTLSYLPDEDAVKKLSVMVTVTASSSYWFDMQLSLQNSYGDILKSIWFPYHLEFKLNQNTEVYLPLTYPGTMVTGKAFEERVMLLDYYPGMYLSDFQGLKINNGKLSIYTLRDGLPVMMTMMGLSTIKNNSYEQLENDDYYYVHQYPVYQDNITSWISPVTRFRIGEPIFESIKACRTDNKLDEFPTLKQKLGDQFDRVSISPVQYIYFGEENPFTLKHIGDVAIKNHSPSLVMANGHFKGGFDHGHYPDVDPDPKWGTEDDYKYMIDELHDAGHLFMPFTLFAGMHSESDTYANLMSQTTIDQIAVIDRSGDPLEEKINDELEYIVSPANPLVFNEWTRLVDKLFDEYQVDFFYQDVVGLAGHDYDFNPHLDNPTLSREGWLIETKTFDHRLQIVEGGNDRMLESCEGFMGSSILSPEIRSYPDNEFVRGIYKHYPVTTTLFHGQMIPFNFWYNTIERPHDLSWNLFYGLILEAPFDSGIFYGDETRNWPLAIATFDFQREVVSRFIGNEVTDFEYLHDQVARITYDDISIVFNNDSTATFDLEDHIISSDGCLVTSESGDLIAGIVNQFNGYPLPEGDHFLIVKYLEDTVKIIHSIGPETELFIDSPSGWSQSNDYWAVGYDSNHNIIGSQDVTFIGGQMKFLCKERLEGQHIAYYKIYSAVEKPYGSWEYFFNDFWQHEVYMGNRSFEICIERPTGNLKHILNKATGDTICHSSLIWQVEFPSNTEGENFKNSNNIDNDQNYSDWEYDWNESDTILKWEYRSLEENDLNVKATLTIDISNEDQIDFQVYIENHLGYPIENVRFPGEINLPTSSGDYVYIPFRYPGLRIKGDYFEDDYYLEGDYPDNLSANYLGLDFGQSHMAIYSITKGLPVHPVSHLHYKPWTAKTNHLYHPLYRVYIQDEESWNSPVVRFRMGKDVQETLNMYQVDNGIDQFPSIQDKLEEQKDALLQSPLIFSAIGLSIYDYSTATALTENFPVPSFILLDWYYPGFEGFNGHHPDIYPPKTEWGTEEEFISMIAGFQEQGHKVAPWTVPVWWNENSPTMQTIAASTGIQDIAVIDREGNPAEAWMGPKGFMVSPNHPTVKSKMNEWYTGHKDTYQFDNVYEHWDIDYMIHADYNSTMTDVAGYFDEWYKHQKNRADANLYLTTGFDKQAEFAQGFIGTMYYPQGEDPHVFGINEDLWDHWPISTAMLRGYSLIYQDYEKQTISKDVLSFNLAFGCMLSLWPNVIGDSGYGSDWWDVVEDFQVHVISYLADSRISNFEKLSEQQTKSSFGDDYVIRNLDRNNAFKFTDHTIASLGAYANLQTANIKAGVFTGYNNNSLSDGDHYIIEKQEEKVITIWHPKGENSEITILKPWSWSTDEAIEVKAFMQNSEKIITRSIDSRKVKFMMSSHENNEKVDRFEIRYRGELSDMEDDVLAFDGLSFSVFPNPVNDLTRVSFNIPSPSHVQLDLINLKGQIIKELIDETIQQGQFSREFSLLQVPDGVYILQFRNQQNILSQKIFVAKNY